MTFASALDSLNTFHIEPLDTFLQITFVVISSFLLAIYLLARFVLKPLGKKIWHRLFHGLSRSFVIGEIVLISICMAAATFMASVAYRYWPEPISLATIGVLTLITFSIAWKWKLEDVCFRISQEFSQMTGWELSDCLAVLLVVPWKWFWSKLSPSTNPLARMLTDAGKDPESFSG